MLHNEHHKFPGIPLYNLRSFHVAAYPYYAAPCPAPPPPPRLGADRQKPARSYDLDGIKGYRAGVETEDRDLGPFTSATIPLAPN
ncbi:hypothetical protein WME75_45670 [Sorangium sp. So ce1014]|uniref:hypothetical protein n=1 Tax=Sorangium sp. So ce1014 TaxID=3133326 RepID=UPI003F5DFBB6